MPLPAPVLAALTGGRAAPPAKAQRLEWLDSIRGISALVVLIGHLAIAFEGPALQKAFYSWFDGRVAVTMFFILSGFVLTRPYLRAPDGGKFRKLLWINFYVRRITRIWLPWVAVFWLSWLVATHIPRTVSFQPAFTSWAMGFWNPLDGLAILKQHIYGLHDPKLLLLPQDWSLGVELKASLLIPVLVILFRLRPWLVAVFGLVLTAAHPTGYYMLTF